MTKKIITKNYKQTQKIGEDFAKKILNCNFAKMTRSCHFSEVVLCLYGDLGAGKTTFLQGFAKGLGIKEKILSPTFVILKHFNMPSLRGRTPSEARRNDEAISRSRLLRRLLAPRNDEMFRNFYHFDCYRINKPKEILELNFSEIIKNPQNIVAIEWPEKIKKYTPKNAIKINFKFTSKNHREIVFL